MTRRLGWVLAPALWLSACGGGGDTIVSMTENHEFAPRVIEASAGETIAFVNDSDEPHTVTAYESSLPDGARFFASGGADTERAARDDVVRGLIEPGGEYRVSLDRPGTYRYFCIPHEGEGMKATIEVGR